MIDQNVKNCLRIFELAIKNSSNRKYCLFFEILSNYSVSASFSLRHVLYKDG